MFQINHWIEAAAPSPKAGGVVNAYPFLLARARRCQTARKVLPNIVAVDFYDQGDVLGVVNTLNSIPRRAPAIVARVAP